MSHHSPTIRAFSLAPGFSRVSGGQTTVAASAAFPVRSSESLEYAITLLASLNVARAVGGVKSNHSIAQGPRLRAVRRRLVARPHLVCRAASATVSRPLLGNGISPSRRVARFRTAFALTYSLNRCAEVTQRCLVNPNKNAFFPELL
jgi:hypothetical protein